MTLTIEFENNPNLPLDKVYYLATPFSHQDKLDGTTLIQELPLEMGTFSSLLNSDLRKK